MISSCESEGYMLAMLAVHSYLVPILGDGSYYSAGPAPFLGIYSFSILEGRNRVQKSHGDFTLNQWQGLRQEEPLWEGVNTPP
jgi:hypothetical protein